jgi:SAM-dependent methyltransferase
MEEAMRKPYQGVLNIIRFNWHFFVFAVVSVILLVAVAVLLNKLIFWICIAIAIGIVTSTFVSLFVSYYVYDRSGLYDFKWLKNINNCKTQNIVNIHAGFDETSMVLKKNFPMANLQVFDFYDKEKHTEVSIERARRAYPPFGRTIRINTSKLPITANSADIILNIFALHEVRDRAERIQFLREQVAGLKNDGRVIVVEHLRDGVNFLAYNVGFFHFFSASEWNDSFLRAGLGIERSFKITPFITVYILSKINGSTH